MKSPIAWSVAAFASVVLLASCGQKPSASDSNGGTKASNGNGETPVAFVPPGGKDEYYLFYSGGHSGQVYVAGIPSMRHIVTIPVFAPYPATGYGFDEESKEMLGKYSWGDVHHPALSQTDSMYDGRWLFVNDNANNRVARIDLLDFKTGQILGPIPNASGTHASSFVTENTEYLFLATRFSTPLPRSRAADPAEYEKEFNGMITAVQVDPETGEMATAWQILMPPINFDLASTGKGPSSGYVFFSSYNSEMKGDLLEVNASQMDRDYAAIVNWREAEKFVAEGRAERMEGVPVINPADAPGVLHYVGVGKSPHGMDTDPTGRWIVGSGKLQPSTTVIDAEKLKKAITEKDFEGEFRGVPVVSYDSVVEGEVPVGLGPLHTQFDGKGNGYTSLFIDSNITKWKLPPWTDEEKANLESVVLDKMPVHFSVGHLVVAGSDTRRPYGKWLVSMNKLAKGRPVGVGPSLPEVSQLIDISGEKMKMVAEAYTEPEPHFAQIIAVEDVTTRDVLPRSENSHPEAVWDMDEANSVREGDQVKSRVIAIRSRFVPDKIEAQVGDELTVHVTNIEQMGDMIHGFAINDHNVNVVIDPGETKTLKVKLEKPGVYPFYCTNFCSALHQEMQGYLVVRPKGGATEPATAPKAAPAPASPPSAPGTPESAQDGKGGAEPLATL